MDSRRIEYRQRMPFYPITFPVNQADGLLVQDLYLQGLIEYINENAIKNIYVCSMNDFQFLEYCPGIERPLHPETAAGAEPSPG